MAAFEGDYGGYVFKDGSRGGGDSRRRGGFVAPNYKPFYEKEMEENDWLDDGTRYYKPGKKVKPNPVRQSPYDVYGKGYERPARRLPEEQPDPQDEPQGGRGRTVGFDHGGDDTHINSSYDRFYEDYHGGGTLEDKPYGGGRVNARGRRGEGDYGRIEAKSKKNRGLNAHARDNRKKAFIISLPVIMLLALAGAVVYHFFFAVKDPIDLRTPFGSLDEAGTYALLKPVIDARFADEIILLSIDGFEASIKLSDFEFGLAIPGSEKSRTIESTDSKGKPVTQTIVTRGKISYNETLLKRQLDLIAVQRGGTPMTEPDFWVKDDKLTVVAGADGYGIDYGAFVQKMEKALAGGSTIELTMEKTVAPEVDPDMIYEEVHKTVKDAREIVDSSGNKTFAEDVVGVDLDLEGMRGAISAGGTSWVIPLTLTQPTVTLKELKADSCPDVLSEFATPFDTTNAARTHNIKIAINAINGTVIKPWPKDVPFPLEDNQVCPEYNELSEYIFSYNETLGERNQQNGYAKATVFSAEAGLDNDYGGGICQVSSTLYYAFIKANLGIDERHAHMFTVPYIKLPDGKLGLGRDATVNWGGGPNSADGSYKDLKVYNNKDYPIRIEFEIKKTSDSKSDLICRIYGTDDGYTAELTTMEMEVYYAKTVERSAAQWPGRKNTTGQMGFKIKSYRIVYYNGERVKKDERGIISVYNALDNYRYV
ncbi:MAG: VanW family protein [Oscillospiraceae bacterium]|nr:VanW family protein [Oscillospiraceae bacterium]